LHGCSGIFGHSAVIADRLSLRVRDACRRQPWPAVSGIANHCDRGLPDQKFDAYAALSYLAQLDFVDPARVDVVGQSMGGETALHAVVDGSPIAQYFFKEGFRAAVLRSPITPTVMALWRES
jgi:dienelactone hydrolase